MLNLRSLRAKKARLALKLSGSGSSLLIVIMLVFAVLSATLPFTNLDRIAYLTSAITVALAIFVMWYRQDLSVLQPTDDSLDGQLTKGVLGVLKSGQINPRSVWVSLSSSWQAQFFINRFLLPVQIIEQNLSPESADMPVIWDKAKQLASGRTHPGIEVGHVVAALLLT